MINEICFFFFFFNWFNHKNKLISSMPLIGEMYLEEKIANNQLAEKYCDSLKKSF